MTDVKKLENIISQISGVIAARVVPDGDGISEIHVMADASKNSKQVVRDVETAIMASTGSKIDRKIISVAQMSSAHVPKQESRVASLNIEEDGKKLVVTVTIDVGDESYTGSASGPRTSIQNLKTSALAVIDALEERTEGIFSVDDVRILTLAGKEFLICHITKSESSEEVSLIGSAELIGDPMKAAASAALDVMLRV